MSKVEVMVGCGVELDSSHCGSGAATRMQRLSGFRICALADPGRTVVATAASSCGEGRATPAHALVTAICVATLQPSYLTWTVAVFIDHVGALCSVTTKCV
jgi:hypothetical protein